MNLFAHVLIYNLIAIGTLLIPLWRNPRFVLHDYPQEIIEAVPPQTPEEKKKGMIWGAPFLINMICYPIVYGLYFSSGNRGSFFGTFLMVFTYLFSFNLVDLFLIDWFLFCFVTPSFLVVPGSRGNRGYGNYLFHFKAFLKGIVIMLVLSLVLSGMLEISTKLINGDVL